jgi:hypothetical protein
MRLPFFQSPKRLPDYLSHQKWLPSKYRYSSSHHDPMTNRLSLRFDTRPTIAGHRHRQYYKNMKKESKQLKANGILWITKLFCG